MSQKVDFIIERASTNKALAMELYCELYIYEHYGTADMDTERTSCNPLNNRRPDWVKNTLNRLNEILRHRSIHIIVDSKGLKELITKKDKLGIKDV